MEQITIKKNNIPKIISCHWLAIMVCVSLIVLTSAVFVWSRSMSSWNSGECSKLSQHVASYTLPSGFYEPNTTLQHEFRIVNDTSSSIHLSRISTSCTCATAELTNNELRPNEEAFLRMSLKLHEATGKRNARCVLSDDNQKYWVFTINSTSYPLMEFAQGGNHAYVHLGTLNPGENGSGTLDVFTYAEPNGQPPMIKINHLENNPLEIMPQSLGVETLPDGFRRRREKVVFQLPEQSEPGLHKADYTISCQTERANQTVSVTVIWQVKSLYMINPSRISLGFLGTTKADEICRTVTLERIDGKPLDIIAVSSSHSGITLKNQIRISPKKTELVVMVDTASFSGPVCGEVSVETGHPVQSHIVIPVVGFR